MYPQLSEPEKNAIREFRNIYERDIGYYEPLLGNREDDEWNENFFPNSVFMIYHMRSEEPGHPNYRLPQYKKVIAKMSPHNVALLNKVIKEMNDRHGWPTIERRKKTSKPKPKRKTCRCKK